MSLFDDDKTYRIPEIAETIWDRRPEWFYRNRFKLQKEAFPKPISRVGYPRYLGKSLNEWCERKQEEDAENGKTNTTSFDMAERTKALREKARRRRAEDAGNDPEDDDSTR